MIQLSDHFDYKRLLRYTLPSIIMLIFTSIYGVVDGYFVSNFVGKTAFTAVNFIMPVLIILGCVGFMFGTGGGALIAITIGAGHREKANQLFSMLVYVSLACGIVLAGLGMLFLRPLLSMLGAEGQMLEDCVTYGKILLPAICAYILQYEFQCLFSTAEKPKLGLYITVAAGLTNAFLDALFIIVFQWGLQGAAAATAIGQCIGGLLPHPLFRPPQHQSAPTDKNAFGRRRTIESMYQRFFGTDEQCLHFPCQHAVQCPAVTLRRRRWSRRLRRVNVCQSDLPVRLYRFFRRRLAGGRLSQWRRKL